MNEKRRSLWLTLAAAAGAAAVAAFVAFSSTETMTFVDEFFAVDARARLFLLLVNVPFVGVAAHVLFRSSALSAVVRERRAFVVFGLSFLAACNLSVLSHHLMLSWVFLELSTFAAFPLIFIGREARPFGAAWRYLIVSTVGLALVFLGLLFISFGVEEVAHREVMLFAETLAPRMGATAALWRKLGVFLVVFGYGTKLGLAPMYSWLPETYDQAPGSVTTMLAAMQSNVVLLALLRVLEAYRTIEPTFVSTELLVMGIASMGVSALHIVKETNIKRLLAHAAINHAGVIAIGLALGDTATYGVMLYLVSNTVVKALLFLSTSAIKETQGTRMLSELRGLIQSMPYTALIFLVGTFALLGFAPFATFIAEIVILQQLLSTGHVAVFVAFVVIATIVFMATGRALLPTVWGEPKEAVVRRESLWPLLPKLLLIAALVVLGLWIPEPLNRLLLSAAAGGAP